MNTSAKLTAVSFLAALALGAAAFTGCTTSSTIDDDTDGGQTGDDDDDDDDAGNGSDTGNNAPACESKQDTSKGILVSETCQTCAERETNCCAEIKTCFDIAGDPEAGLGDCHYYVEGSDECQGKPEGEERETCYKDLNDTSAPGVQEAYEALVDCAVSKCATECGGQ